MTAVSGGACCWMSLALLPQRPGLRGMAGAAMLARSWVLGSRLGAEQVPPEPPPDTETVRGVRSWLDRHAHRESRTRRYLELVQAVASVLTFGG
ncbi:MAG: hypothetical protein U0031_23375, partial [Thermomicrobiales bacterium]